MLEVTGQVYTAMLTLQCPYCAAGLPDYRDSDSEKFIHSIPGTDHRFPCEATKLRGKFDINTDHP